MTARSRALAGAVAALLCAASAFLLPALDADLPGGSIYWQVGALAAALAGAWWSVRRLPSGVPAARARLVRIVATLAVMVALVWLGGIALLWLIWPR